MRAVCRLVGNEVADEAAADGVDGVMIDRSACLHWKSNPIRLAHTRAYTAPTYLLIFPCFNGWELLGIRRCAQG